jgi:hypothetical protein
MMGLCSVYATSLGFGTRPKCSWIWINELKSELLGLKIWKFWAQTHTEGTYQKDI